MTQIRRLALSLAISALSLLTAADSSAEDSAAVAKPAAASMIGTKPGQVRDDNGLKMKLVWCPPGPVKMGSSAVEAKSHGRNNEEQTDTTVTKGIWLGQYEVTQAEWKQVMATEPWKGQQGTKDGDDIPVTFVNWNDAMEFGAKLTEQESKAGRLAAGWEYTLPTEAQWERACRAETATSFSFGNDPSQLGDYAWYVDNAAGASEKYPHPVGQKKPNPWGLYDIHGNVFEWCRDFYSIKLPGGNDPEVKNANGRLYVIRGGCWQLPPGDCRCARRVGSPRRFYYNDLGFRVACSPSG